MKLAHLFIAVLTVILAASATSAAVPPDFVAMAKRLKPVVVNISCTPADNTETNKNDLLHRDVVEKFFRSLLNSNDEREEKRSLGSGLIISADGYILTNEHVVKNSHDIKVKLANGKVYPAAVRGIDNKLDLALLKISAKNSLPTVTLGNSDNSEVGEWVMAIGNPFGLGQTVTVGIVSAMGRVIGAGPYDNFIQTDASINPGNSGGPLFNARGQVIGINTAIVRGGQGIGFAIPINAAKKILPQLKKTGHVTRCYLGITVQDISSELAESFGLNSSDGALITSVASNSPAQRAGLQRGDIILAMDGHQVKDKSTLPRLVADLPVGGSSTITVFRSGNKLTLTITPTTAPDTAPAHQAAASTPGITTMDNSAEISRHLDLATTAGVVITSVATGSPAERAHLRRSDVILEYNGIRITSSEQLRAAFAASVDKTVQRLLVQRGERLFFTALTLPHK